MPRPRFGHARRPTCGSIPRPGRTSRRSCRAIPIRANLFAESRATTRTSECRRPHSKKPPLTKEQIELVAEVDQGGREVRAALGVHSAAATGSAASEADGLAAQRHRSVPAREAGSARASAHGRRPIAPTLVRRLYFDLTGLPPTPAQVDEFVDDTAARRVREARRQAARVAGVRRADGDVVVRPGAVRRHGRLPRRPGSRITPYRDYVIKAFNDNLPFDQFTIEQLAGDLLPNPTMWQLVATGYNRVLQTTHEGGAQDAEYRANHAGRPRAEFLRNVDGRLDGLRRVPRPQVRPVHAGRFLQPAGVLRRRGRVRLVPGRRQQHAAHAAAARDAGLDAARVREDAEARREDRQARRSVARRSDQGGLGEASRRADQAQEGAARSRGAVRADDDHQGGAAARDSHPAARQLDGQIGQGRPAAHAALPEADRHGRPPGEPARSGELARLARQSADGARGREPAVEAVLRHRAVEGA